MTSHNAIQVVSCTSWTHEARSHHYCYCSSHPRLTHTLPSQTTLDQQSKPDEVWNVPRKETHSVMCSYYQDEESSSRHQDKHPMKTHSRRRTRPRTDQSQEDLWETKDPSDSKDKFDSTSSYTQNFLNDNKHTEETINTLIKVKAYLSSYLEEMDVFEFEIKPGKSTRELSSEEFEIDSVETTEDGNLQDKVVLTSKKGYENIHPNGKNILVKAKVKVYKKEKKIG